MSFGPQYGPEGSEPDHIEFPGSASGPGPRRRHGLLLPVLGIGLVALAGGGGLAYVAQHSASPAVADTSSSAQSAAPNASPSPSTSPLHRFRGGFGGFGFGGPGFGFGGFGGAIHGQLIEPKSGGGYQTVDVQRGTVTAVSSSSITVKSADGFTATYAVAGSTEVNAQAAGIATVKVGDTVSIVATVSSGKATAASIIDMTVIRASRGTFGFPSGPPTGSQN
ncbi:MAG TPA: hypothetical protein VEL03_19245 [Streptosporangiaceae bacterium]|nr:hypothetical protein [Streptosporangiaceae bacterium]